MILLVLGTQKFQLNRLLMAMDEAVETGKITEKVLAQKGYSDYQPKNYEAFDFLDKALFEKAIGEADLVVAHSGVGTIMTALNAGKKVLVYPRLAKYKEHVDNHQLDIAKAFARKNYVDCYDEGQDLAECIKRCKDKTFDRYVSNQKAIVKLIREYIDSY